MAEQINQDITIPDDPPSSRDKVNFRLRADDFVAWMKVFATQMNSLIPKVNASLSWINTNVQNALSYSQTATAQAGVATTKAGEASACAAAALASKEAAEAIFDNFDDKYLGAKPTAPIVDNDGNPLTTGALYFKTTAPTGIYVYDAELSIWSSPTYVPTSHGSLSGLSDADAHPMSAITGLVDELQQLDNKVILSGVAAYHIYNGKLSLANSVITNGFSTTLYTGNGSTQSVNTGVDMATQWGNSASEAYGGLIWIKNRNTAIGNKLIDTVRGNFTIGTETASAQWGDGSFVRNSAGFSVTDSGSSGYSSNTNTTTYATWSFQTTHRKTGTTNHGQAYTCHYNPFTGFTMVQYTGSGLAGHEIPHSLGRKLGFVIQKDLTDTVDWLTYNGEIGSYMSINTAAGRTSDSSLNMWRDVTDTSISLGIHSNLNESGKQHILYGWTNSYFDEANTLIGNYEIGVYQGTGVAGNKVTTRGKPAFVMIKRLDSAGDWGIFDNQRNDLYLYANVSQTETSYDVIDILSDGFVQTGNVLWSNASGGTYLYMVVYDNDTGSGKSKYPRATDTSTLNLTAHVPFANGVDTTGTKVSLAYKNETITLSNSLVQGKNYIASLSDGTYVASPYEPMYLMRDRVKAGENPNYFDLAKQKWFATTGGSELVTNGTFDSNTNGWVSGGSDTISWNTTKSMRLTSVNGNGNGITQTLTTVIGKKYTLSFNVTFGTRDTVAVDIDNTRLVNYSTVSGYKNIQFIANSTSTLLEFSCATATAGLYLDLDSISVFETVPTIGAAITARNYLDCVVYVDQNGQPTYVEQIEKATYFDVVKANEFKGKNACTAWASVDGTTTPIVINDSFNISSIIRISTGVFRLMYKKRLDNANVSLGGSTSGNTTQEPKIVASTRDYIDISVSLYNANAYNDKFCIQIFGGKE